MAEKQWNGVKSTASIAGHPIHPILIPFPIAFLVGAFLTDIGYWVTQDAFWARASLWLVAAGVVSGAVAAIFGLTDFLTIRRAREHAAGWIHFLGNAFALSLGLISWIMRTGDPAQAVVPWGIIFTGVITLALVVTGWFGGELAYRHRIGVVGHEQQQNQARSRPTEAGEEEREEEREYT
jgi:uncharacterized membrane protein